MSRSTVAASLEECHWPILLPIGDQKHIPRFPIEGTSWIAGSRSTAQIVLKSKLVSRSHAIIVNDIGETYVRDLGSTNGVYVNNQPLREGRLSDGDILNIGRFQFICYSGFPSEEDVEPQDVFDAELQVEGTDRVTQIHLRSMLIGRREKCELKLDDPSITPVHAVIYRCDGRRYLRDLSSPSGTFLNHQRIRDAEIRPGDMIRLGETILRYERTEESLRGGWVPPLSVEIPEPIRLADQDDGTLDPMTDSSLERALREAEEMEIAPEPAPVRRKKKKKPVVLKSKSPKLAPAPNSEESFETLAEILADADNGAMPSGILDRLESGVWDEGPTPRNVDLPQPPPRAERPGTADDLVWDAPSAATAGKTDQELADLLEDGFFRGTGL